MSEKKIFVHPDEVETQKFDWGSLQWMSEPRVTAADRFSCGVVTLGPGQGHIRHNHPESEEILYFIKGKAMQTVDDEERECSQGELVHIPKAVYHSTVNHTDEEVVILAVYSPHGPEAQLRAMPECEVLPPKKVPA